jgi:hypothetical protein
MPDKLISVGKSQRASYSLKPVGVICGVFSNAGVFGAKSETGIGNRELSCFCDIEILF